VGTCANIFRKIDTIFITVVAPGTTAPQPLKAFLVIRVQAALVVGRQKNTVVEPHHGCP
jgi:hypothetical protein